MNEESLSTQSDDCFYIRDYTEVNIKYSQIEPPTSCRLFEANFVVPQSIMLTIICCLQASELCLKLERKYKVEGLSIKSKVQTRIYLARQLPSSHSHRNRAK